MTFILISTDDDVDFTEITVQEHLPGMPEIEIVIMMIRMMHDDTDADVNLTEISVQEHLPKMPEMVIMMIIVIIEMMIMDDDDKVDSDDIETIMLIEFMHWCLVETF